jgi:malate dehydrogenase
MSRDDLIISNIPIVGDVAEKAAKFSPNAIMIVVANPVDAMVYLAWKKTGFEPNRVMGMAGVLDTARFKTFISMELGVSTEDIQALILGGHGDDMVPISRYCTVGGIPVAQLIAPERLKEIEQRARVGGGEIVGLLKTGSAYYAPAASAVEMSKSILRDKNRILPTVAHLDNKYGESGIFVGVPAILDSTGVKEVIEIDLNEEEKDALAKSIESVKIQVKTVDSKL